MAGNWNRIAVVAGLVGLSAPLLVADSNVADPKKSAWGENVGWTNWRDANSTTDGVEVYRTGGTQYLRGWVWGENIGWIHVGDGAAPYANTDGTNFGVNIDPGTGDMTGFAWAENVGWINFGPFPIGTLVQSATWNHALHKTEGYAWGENIGWINLDDAIRYVCAVPGDLNGDGTVDAFDFGIFAPNFGSSGNPAFTLGDIDGDGDTDVFDFGLLAPSFGVSCP